MDEPSEGLAPNIVDNLVAVFKDLRSAGLTIVLVEQHARLALQMTDDAIVLVRGAYRPESEQPGAPGRSASA